MLAAGRGIDRLNRLGFRLAVLLSVALLPLGLIAVLQTKRVIEEGRERAEAALMGRTLQAARVETELIQGAIGAARALGATLPPLRDDRQACSALARRFVEVSPDYVFAGYIEPGGAMRCVSEGVSMNFADSPAFRDLADAPRVRTALSRRGPISDEPVVIVTVPVMGVEGDFDGAVSISVPHAALLEGAMAADGTRPFDVVTFNADGEVLFAAAGLPGVEERLPAGVTLAGLAEVGSASFIAPTEAGPERVFTVVPIIDGTVYAVATWGLETVPGLGRVLSLPGVGIPILMWLASLGVAYYAVHRLVIRHIRRLRHQIRVFTSARRTLAPPPDDELPAELREVSDAFHAMTDRIIADEADLENSLHEKNVLLREVHHRVKNNLQLITSMISMQMRRTEDPAMRQQLRRLQDRVHGLAVIHRNLHHASSLSRVRADVLVEEIVRQMLIRAIGPGSGIEVRHRLDETTLYPDQALPLAMLANEAVTNALKYLGAPAEGSPRIDVRLRNDGDGRVTLSVTNSVGPPVAETLPEKGQGLGSQLIRAFATQLGGELTLEEAERCYVMKVQFRVAEFSAEGSPSVRAAQ